MLKCGWSKAEPRLQRPVQFKLHCPSLGFLRLLFSFQRKQVAYQVCGRPRSILEAAALRGFTAVSGPTLEQVLRDIKAQSGRQTNKRDKILAVVNAFKASWNWSELQVARCLLAAETSSKRKSVKQPDLMGDEQKLAKVMAALKKHTAAKADDVVAEIDTAKALAETVVALRMPRPKRSSRGFIGK